MVLTNHRLTAVSGSTLVSPVYILPTFIIAKGLILINGRSFYALLFPCASSGFVHLAFPVFALMKTRPYAMPCGARFHSSVYIKTSSHASPVFFITAIQHFCNCERCERNRFLKSNKFSISRLSCSPSAFFFNRSLTSSSVSLSVTNTGYGFGK